MLAGFVPHLTAIVCIDRPLRGRPLDIYDVGGEHDGYGYWGVDSILYI